MKVIAIAILLTTTIAGCKKNDSVTPTPTNFSNVLGGWSGKKVGDADIYWVIKADTLLYYYDTSALPKNPATYLGTYGGKWKLNGNQFTDSVSRGAGTRVYYDTLTLSGDFKTMTGWQSTIGITNYSISLSHVSTN